MKISVWIVMSLSLGCVSTGEGDIGQGHQAVVVGNNHPENNPLGAAASVSTLGDIDLDSDFFAEFGVNGRTCGSCHDHAQGWTVSAAGVQARFDASDGLDPIFRLVDGANAPDAAVGTVDERRDAYSMLLSRGVIRVGLAIPAGAEFELVAVDDPYGHASAAELSLFRRPLPSANLAFAPAVMWDGRETGDTLALALGSQANNATLGHAEALAPLPAAALDAIVELETAITHAQLIGQGVGRLDAAGGNGGPELLVDQPIENGFMTLYDGWDNAPPSSPRAAVVRGQEVFNTIVSPAGRTCRGCHSAANVGTSAAQRFFDVGVSDGAIRTADLPLYTLRNLTTGEERQTTDPGRALITGLWRDVDRFKVPSLRGLGARAPYFHNGSASTLDEVLDHYELQLGFEFTAQERADLIAFMSAL